MARAAAAFICDLDGEPVKPVGIELGMGLCLIKSQGNGNAIAGKHIDWVLFWELFTHKTEIDTSQFTITPLEFLYHLETFM